MFGQRSLDGQSGVVGSDEESEGRRMDDTVTSQRVSLSANIPQEPCVGVYDLYGETESLWTWSSRCSSIETCSLER